MKHVSVTALRQNLFKLVDEALETGIPVEIERRGRKLLLIPQHPASKLDRLKRRPAIQGDADDLVDLSAGEWNEADKL
jgi:prevent-host-death family protein